MKNIYLKRGKEESLKRFHPWVFSGAIHHMSEEPAEGEIVEVFSSEGDYVATGHFEIGSIMVRVLSFDHEDIDQAFYERRIAIAKDVRMRIGVMKDDNNTYRLVHGEGDNLSGLVIDVYGHTAVMQAHSVGMHLERHTIAAALKNVMGDELQNIYYKSEIGRAHV